MCEPSSTPSVGVRARSRRAPGTGTRSPGRRPLALALTATLVAGTCALCVAASASGAAPVGISAAGTRDVYGGYIGSSTYRAAITPAATGDLLVVAVMNDTWADYVTSVSGGDVATWSAASAPDFDGTDGHIFQIWYGAVSATTNSTLSISWNGTINNVGVCVEEYSAGTAVQWSVAASGNASSPFPALNAPSGGGLYFGAAMAWSNAAAGSTPGFSYLVPTSDFLLAWDTSASGRAAPPPPAPAPSEPSLPPRH